ncbi:flagellar basal body-associated FliL family protein [Sulfitobacter marinus]|uniref:flagellar basal body-associated FliL family protein n=1 Tax=Sulfitobacter marinus TaxID=394264 RepID=UPI0015875A0B|nr:flagellar basal body-associated FliL family protein [Sulfitobacter marinus]
MKKTLVIVAVILLCVLAGVGGVTLAMGSDKMLSMVGLGQDTPAEEQGAAQGQGDAEAGQPRKADAGDMPVMPFPEIIVNVTDTGINGRHSSRFLKLNMLMVYDDTREGADRLLAREIYLRDTFQDFLRQLHVSDLKGSQGLALIKTELLRRARAVGHTEAPVEILIADMVVQ